MFSTEARSIDAIPNKTAALLQHTHRALFQGGHVWGQAHHCTSELPSPGACGWCNSDRQG